MSDEKIQAFLDELTALSHKHGLGINPDGDLFELEADDSNVDICAMVAAISISSSA